ncbi:unnamed protein product [Phytophthora fragariaefolia]|uniref:Unnamed protein product n=1 Tax=Phytophthora fragariaefolia TaxID=1490495 RepID=A0A9W6X7A2_9STRA|nr:unnamed protein product [Phytophthora fragariaefolia]
MPTEDAPQIESCIVEELEHCNLVDGEVGSDDDIENESDSDDESNFAEGGRAGPYIHSHTDEITATKPTSQNPGQGQKPKQSHNSAQTAGTKQVAPERAASRAAKKTDQQSGSCFLCHKTGHLQKYCPKKHNPNSANSSQSKRQAAYSSQSKRQAAYSRRVRPVASVDQKCGHPQTHASTRRPEESSADVAENMSTTGATDQGTGDYSTWEWCFDNSANVHMVATNGASRTTRSLFPPMPTVSEDFNKSLQQRH